MKELINSSDSIFDHFDSREEVYLYWYFEELLDKGFVRRIEHEARSFTLFDPYTYNEKAKTDRGQAKAKVLFRGHRYTPDFEIEWWECAKNVFFHFQIARDATCDNGAHMKLKKSPFVAFADQEFSIEPADFKTKSIIEVKGDFDRNNMTRLFRLNQKWMIDKHGLITTLVTPKKLFEKTFTPRRYLYQDKNQTKLRKINFTTRTLEQFVELQTTQS